MDSSRWRKKKYWLNLLKAFVLTLFSVAFLICYIVYPSYRGYIRLRPPRSIACCRTPADLGMRYEEVSFTTRDSFKLKGWYIPSRNHAAVLIAHGAGGNRASHLDQAQALNQAGYGVLLVELRGNGESDGDIITFSGEDVLAGIQFLKSRPEIDPGRIGAMGCSLGAMTAIQAAALTTDIRALIAEGPSPAAIADEPAPRNVGEALMLPAYFTEYIIWYLQGAAPPISITRALAAMNPRPILLIAAGELEPEAQFVENFYDHTPGPKEIWIVPGAGHCGGWQAQKGAYQQKMITFFEDALISSR